MLIKLLEKHPIIASSEAKMIGMVKGVILEENRLVSILSSIEVERGSHLNTYKNDIDRYIEIPVENLIIGSDAFMIEESTVANVHFAHGQTIKIGTSLYTCTGEHVGRVTAIDIDTDYTLQSIHTDDSYVGVGNIIKIGDVIIVDPEIMEENLNIDLEDSEVFLTVTNEEKEKDVREEIAAGRINIELDEEEIVDTVEPEYTGLVNPVDEEYQEKEWGNGAEVIYSRYRYLLGKRLINQIVVADRSYPKDCVIDAKLIEDAINKNCILSVIMNAED